MLTIMLLEASADWEIWLRGDSGVRHIPWSGIIAALQDQIDQVAKMDLASPEHTLSEGNFNPLQPAAQHLFLSHPRPVRAVDESEGTN